MECSSSAASQTDSELAANGRHPVKLETHVARVCLARHQKSLVGSSDRFLEWSLTCPLLQSKTCVKIFIVLTGYILHTRTHQIFKKAWICKDAMLTKPWRYGDCGCDCWSYLICKVWQRPRQVQAWRQEPWMLFVLALVSGLNATSEASYLDGAVFGQFLSSLLGIQAVDTFLLWLCLNSCLL